MLMRSRLRLTQAREQLERHDGLAPVREWLLALGEREIRFVAWAWRGTLRPALRHAAVAVSWLGNGAAYLVLAAVLLVTVEGALRPLIAAGLSVLLAHLIYPWTKVACSRQRPCELRVELEPRLASLDRHSFPSGHVMTLCAALTPLVAAFPGSLPLALLAWLLMAWSRIACAHHYPSDIVAGSALGLAVAAVPIALLL